MVVLKNPPANAEDARDEGSIPESGKTPWKEEMATHPNILAYQNFHGQRCLETTFHEAANSLATTEDVSTGGEPLTGLEPKYNHPGVWIQLHSLSNNL